MSKPTEAQVIQLAEMFNQTPSYTMLVKTTVNETKEVTREINLPYFAKDKSCTTFFRVNEDESVLRVDIIKNYKGEITYAAMTLQNQTDGLLQDILKGEESTESEFEEAISDVVEHMDTKVKAFV